jgi:hypothetical protein
MLFLFINLFDAKAMAPAPFSMLQSRLEDASFSSEQLLLLTSLGEHTTFTCSQVSILLEEISFSKDKLKAVTALSPKISDIENYNTIFDAFDFMSDKAAANTILSEEAKRREEDQYHSQEFHLQTELYNNQNELYNNQNELYNNQNEQYNNQRKRYSYGYPNRYKSHDRHYYSMNDSRGNTGMQREFWFAPRSNTKTHQYEPFVQWVGTCPSGVYSNGEPAGPCVPLRQDLFDPFSSDGHQLWLQTRGKGIVTITMELGAEVYGCQKEASKQTEFVTWKLPVYQDNQIIDIGAMIDNWDREDVRIYADFQEHSSGVYLKDWKKCH